MFESLTDRMSNALRKLRGVDKISEENMADALADVRNALLSADVHFRVAREFVEGVKADCVGQDVLKGVDPGQQTVKIIHDRLVSLLGEGRTGLVAKRPLRILLVGLHGSGKTTSAGKLARHLVKKEGFRHTCLVGCDIYRPAAIDQLEILAKAEGASFYADRHLRDVPAIGEAGLRHAEAHHADAVIFDTAGRLQIDADLIEEVKRLKAVVQPDEVLLVADAALGQEAVNVAKHFHEAVSLTGIILTKLDGDARGGAALSMKAITGVPIKFMGHGEKTADLDVFHPDRMAQRILGMGDVVSLVEKAQEALDQKESERLEAEMRAGKFDFELMLGQMRQVKRLGSLGGLMKMMPGGHNLNLGDKEEAKMKRTEAIILSMTVKERRNPDILNGSRRARIARGAGVPASEVNALVKQFTQMREMMEMFKGGPNSGKMKELMRQAQAMQRSGKMPPGLGGGGGMPRGGFPGFGGGRGGFPKF